MTDPTLFGDATEDTAWPTPTVPAAVPGATRPERDEVARAVLGTLSDAAAGRASGDEVYRALRGALYVLTPAETDELARVFLTLLGRSK